MRKPWWLVLLALWAFCGCGAVAASTWVQGQVAVVSDGDSLWLQPAVGQNLPADGLKKGRLQLRIKDMDAPESCQAGGAQATAALRAQIQGQQVKVELLHRDKYQRWLVRVYAPSVPDGGDVGAWMVAQGHAWDYQYPSLKQGRYAPQQAQAKAQGLGLWAEAGAIHPQQFRRAHGPCFAPSSKAKAAKNKAAKPKKKTKPKKQKQSKKKPSQKRQ